MAWLIIKSGKDNILLVFIHSLIYLLFIFNMSNKSTDLFTWDGHKNK